MTKTVTKITAVIISLVFLFSLAGCVPSNPTAMVELTVPEYKSSEFKALADYLVKNKLVEEKALTLTSVDLIGADEGYRYTAGEFGSVEIYYFSDTSSKEYNEALNGKVTIFKSEYNAAVSKDGKFVLVYALDVDPSEIGDEKSNLVAHIKAYPDLLENSENKNTDSK